MSDYRRLISYIYEYEGKEKGKNVGFVKLEARNGQCRLNLSVKKVYVGGNAIGVYLLGKNRQETFLGNIFIRGGNGEFRTTVDAQNVEESGNPLDTYYGLTVHDVKNSWRSYTTIWEDAILPPTEEAGQIQTQNADSPISAAENGGRRRTEEAAPLIRLGENDTAVRMAQEVLPEAKRQPQPVSGVVKEIEEEIAREEERKDMEARTLTHAAEVGVQENVEEAVEKEAAPELIPGLFAPSGAVEVSGRPEKAAAGGTEPSGDRAGADGAWMAGSALKPGRYATGYAGAGVTAAGNILPSGMYAAGSPGAGGLSPSGACATGYPAVGNPPLSGMYATGYAGAEMRTGAGGPLPSGIYATGYAGAGIPAAQGSPLPSKGSAAGNPGAGAIAAAIGTPCPSEAPAAGNTDTAMTAAVVTMPSGMPPAGSMEDGASTEAGTFPQPGAPAVENTEGDIPSVTGTPLPSQPPAAGNTGTVPTSAPGTLPSSEAFAPGTAPGAPQPAAEGARRNQPGPFMRPGMLGAGPGWFGPLRIPGMNGGRPGTPRMPEGNTAHADQGTEPGEQEENPETERGSAGQTGAENPGDREPADEVQARQNGPEPNLNVIEFSDYSAGQGGTGVQRGETPASPELENPEVLKYLRETEESTADPELMWQELRRSYPKIQPFDYEDGCEVLTIHPQDIGRLPRESWVYGNNSFLLHGYYSFRYLILVRLGNRKGKPRYLIGVPGHYFSSEKYMASMFGFPNFVLSKKQPPNDNRFGYWYTDIRLR